ncbi:unnamed protein product, partial [Mesorhabditis spiculigera]
MERLADDEAEDPGLMVLIADAGNYSLTLTHLQRKHWRLVIVHPAGADPTFTDYADEALTMDELLDWGQQEPDDDDDVDDEEDGDGTEDEEQLKTAQPFIGSRCFLLQVPAMPVVELWAQLGPDQHMAHFNKVTREAVIVIEADTVEETHRSLQSLLNRVCLAVGYQPADVAAATSPKSLLSLPTAIHLPPPAVPPKPPKKTAWNGQAAARQLNNNTEQHGYAAQRHNGDASNFQARKPPRVPSDAKRQNSDAPGASSASFGQPRDPFAIGAQQLRERDREQRQKTQATNYNNRRYSPGNVGKTAEDGYRHRATHQPLRRDFPDPVAPYVDHRNPNGHYQKPAVTSGGGGSAAPGAGTFKKHGSFRDQPHDYAIVEEQRGGTGGGTGGARNRDYCYLQKGQKPVAAIAPISPSPQTPRLRLNAAPPLITKLAPPPPATPTPATIPASPLTNAPPAAAKTPGGAAAPGALARERFRKPAPQCVFWENRFHRQETGCTLWHPKETCRFYPTCAHQAQDCGFAHPFCGPKCHCDPGDRNPQLNHWTEHLQRNFGVPSHSTTLADFLPAASTMS